MSFSMPRSLLAMLTLLSKEYTKMRSRTGNMTDPHFNTAFRVAPAIDFVIVK